MAIKIEVRGRVSSFYPPNGKAFTINDLVNVLGANISIYELTAQSKHGRDRASYVVTSRSTARIAHEKNQTVSNIYAPFMKGLTDRVVYGNALLCMADELEPSE